MADAKISALTNLTAADPTNDMIPIVDVSDTPPASGNTKRISINNILSSSPTASGALTVTGLVTAGSATITGAATVGTTLGVTGDLTVDTNVLKVDTTNNRVGIGTASPTAVLTVNGEISVTDNFALRVGSNQAGGATLLYNGSGNLDITPRSGFHTKLVDGNLIIGTSGKGIDFSAVTGGTGTATANVLNDYEEGTFTATLKGSTTDPTIAVTTTGKYTKIGNQVFVRIMFGNVSTLGASGAISITGLPFTSASAPEQIGYLMVENMATFTNSSLSSYLAASSSTLNLYTSTSNSVITQITHNAGVARYLWTAITYTV